ncbi:MAG: c-type cytochrome [Steroidobacteraceae bacterium]
MKYIGALLAIPLAILTILLSGTRFAAGAPANSISEHILLAKIQYCQDCHGPSGRGTVGGYLPIPRIAGQAPEYIERQLLAFSKSMRDKNSSVGITSAHAVSPAMRALLAAHFSSLDPEPIGGGPRDLVATGRTIYEEGVPADNVPACSGCHGPGAKGTREIPRLAGQIDSYTERELKDWSTKRGQNPLKAGAAAPMKHVANSLSPSQIAAVAAYLSYLKR